MTNVAEPAETRDSAVAVAWTALQEMKITRTLLIDTDQGPTAIAAAGELIVDRWTKLANAEIGNLLDAELIVTSLWSSPHQYTRAVAADAVLGLAAYFGQLYRLIEAGGTDADDALAAAMIFPLDDPMRRRSSVPIVRSADRRHSASP